MAANTDFRTYEGPFSLSADPTGPNGLTVVAMSAADRFDAIRINEGGMITDTVVSTAKVENQTFQSLLPGNVFTGSSGNDTVEYSQSPSRVIADLQSGYGINAFGGTDRYQGIENLTGSAFGDILAGDAGNNVFIGGMGNDNIMGRQGMDVAQFAGVRSGSFIMKAGTTTIVAGPQGVDTLDSVERLQFSDRGVAFDLDSGQSAGNTVRILGAAFGAQNIQADLVGIGMNLFDSGHTQTQVAQHALDSRLFLNLAGSRSDVDFVNTVYRNVFGFLPTAPERDFYVGLLQGSGGTMTQAELLVVAANGAQNAANIDLVGLQQSGVEFF